MEIYSKLNGQPPVTDYRGSATRAGKTGEETGTPSGHELEAKNKMVRRLGDEIRRGNKSPHELEKLREAIREYQQAGLMDKEEISHLLALIAPLPRRESATAEGETSPPPEDGFDDNHFETTG